MALPALSRRWAARHVRWCRVKPDDRTRALNAAAVHLGWLTAEPWTRAADLLDRVFPPDQCDWRWVHDRQTRPSQEAT